MPKIDVQATAAAHFQDPDSFIFKDGREFLRGKDWDARRFELVKRCGGRCEYVESKCSENLVGSERCTGIAEHPHHMTKKSIAHDDRLFNLKALCWFHHRLMHPEKQLRSAKVTA